MTQIESSKLQLITLEGVLAQEVQCPVSSLNLPGHVCVLEIEEYFFRF